MGKNITQFLSNSGASTFDLENAIIGFRNRSPDFHERIKEIPESIIGIHNAIAALSHIRALKQEIILPPPEQVSTEDAARVALNYITKLARESAKAD